MKMLPRLLFTALLAGLLCAGLFPSPARAQAAECRGSTYTVRAGESLYSIAVKCNIPFAGLVGINVELSDSDRIYPGQVIRLVASTPLYNNPATGPAEEGGLQPWGEYIVRRGDSLARIAYLYTTTVEKLIALNPETGPHGIIYPRQALQIPEDARLEKGWVGVSTLIASARDRVVVRVVDFPPYADIDLRVGQLDEQYDVVYDAKTDARGQARVEITLPSLAWYDEVWVVEVVTTELAREVRALSPGIVIE
jgi:LysM repeat protein